MSTQPPKNRPAGPGQPNRPVSGPGQPNRPMSGPGQPNRPPSGSGQPNRLANPGQPNRPAGPGQPNRPAGPGQPNRPAGPGQPNRPAGPGRAMGATGRPSDRVVRGPISRRAQSRKQDEERRQRNIRIAAAVVAVLVVLVAGFLLLRGGSSGAASPSATAAGASQSAGASGASSAATSAGASGAAATPAAAYATPTDCPTKAPAAFAATDSATVTFETAKGSIVMAIKGSLAPNATGNFVALATCHFYDGVVFHRLVPGFVIQGGDGQYGREPNVDASKIGTGGPGYTITDDPVTATYKRGVVAMGRVPNVVNSQGSQFFIVLSDGAASALAAYNDYAILGEVTSGMDVVDAIGAMPNSGSTTGNAALDPLPITNVTVTRP